MGKLGKKARKFAKKKLPAVLKRQRQQKSLFNKRKSSSRAGNGDVKDQGRETTATRKPVIEDPVDVSLDLISSEEENAMVESGSDTDGYLSEDSSCLVAGGTETELDSEDIGVGNKLSSQNQQIQSEVLEKQQKLEALKKKDPGFMSFLQSRINDHKSLSDEEMSDDDEMTNDDIQSTDGDTQRRKTGRVLKSSTIDSWCQMVKDQQKSSVLPSILNAYRVACCYGADSINATAYDSSPIILREETFSSILMFMLSEGDQLLRGLLDISPDCKREAVIKLKNSSKWENSKPIVKSYLTSTLFLLNQLTDTDILAYALIRLRASLILFAVFPSFQSKLTKVVVHHWATGRGALSSSSFLILRDMPYALGPDSYEKCLKETYKATLIRCNVVDPASLKHMEYLRDSFVELCSIDLQKSVKMALASTQKLATILKFGLQTKEEALKKICTWDYVLCVDIWVKFVSANIKDIDLQPILFTMIQVIHGMTKLFAGERYLPLKVKCIQWLNLLSSSSGTFIPVSSLALDILENSNAEEDGKPGKGGVNLSTSLKLPKHWLKSHEFQGACVSTAVELLCAHFLQWTHHISFPELATIPIIHLKQFHDKSTIESLCRTVKRLIDQVERNIDFVRRNREDVSFSPKDQDSADSFLQIEKGSDNAPYIQYYKSVIQNATTRKVNTDDQISMPGEKNLKRRKRKLQQKTEDGIADGDKESAKTNAEKSTKNRQNVRRKKHRT